MQSCISLLLSISFITDVFNVSGSILSANLTELDGIWHEFFLNYENKVVSSGSNEQVKLKFVNGLNSSDPPSFNYFSKYSRDNNGEILKDGILWMYNSTLFEFQLHQFSDFGIREYKGQIVPLAFDDRSEYLIFLVRSCKVDPVENVKSFSEIQMWVRSTKNLSKVLHKITLIMIQFKEIYIDGGEELECSNEEAFKLLQDF